MRIILFTCLIFIHSIALAESEIQVNNIGVGVVQCGNYLSSWDDINERKIWLDKMTQHWVSGYLSALMTLQGTYFKSNDIPIESFSYWIAKYCRENPLKIVQDGAIELYLELVSK